MRILVINWRDIKNPEAGGAEVHIHEILKRLPQKFEIDFVSSTFKGCLKKEKIDRYVVLRIPNKYVFNFIFPIYWFLKLRKKNYDIIIDDISKIPLGTPLYIKKKPIVSIVHHIHGKTLFLELNPFLALYVYFMEKIMLKFYKNLQVITVSNSSRNELIKKDFSNVDIVYNGIGRKFLNKFLGIRKSSKPTIIYLGRLKKYKKVSDVIKAFKIVKEVILDAKLWIVGTGEERKKLEKLAKDLKLKDVTFWGFVSEEEKFNLLRKSWIYVICSEKEGFGISVIEANAVGTPAIGYKVSGLIDSIKDGYNGLLVENGNIQELSEKLIDVLSNTDLRETLSKNAIEWAKQFSWDKSAKEFERILEYVANSE